MCNVKENARQLWQYFHDRYEVRLAPDILQFGSMLANVSWSWQFGQLQRGVLLFILMCTQNIKLQQRI